MVAKTKPSQAGPKPAAVRNPQTHHFEFMGPHLSSLVILGMTVVPTLLHSLCSNAQCPPVPSSWTSAGVMDLLADTFAETVGAVTWTQVVQAGAVVVAWYAWQAVLYLVMPGKVVPGTLIRDGTRLTYPINAFNSLLATYATLFLLSATYGPTLLLWVAHNTLPLCLASTLLSILQSLALYAASFRATVLHTDAAKARKDGEEVVAGKRVPVLCAEGGNSGYPVYDFFIGRELNPRFYGFDFKYFCELRPGLIGWTVLNLANAVSQGVERSGGEAGWGEVIGGVTNSMWLVYVFQGYYVVDALWNEQAILTTMDLTTDGFGFMLNFGDLVWVPFTYTLQSKYLTMFPQSLSTPVVAALVALKLFGLYVFRGSNGQKNAFRTNPDAPACKHLKFLETKSGSKLLVTGWWGVARHVNYTGDWLMALSWCLPTGFGSPIPYFYAFYFGILLWHREMRDEHKCRAKYGADWDRYCEKVKYRFIPGVY
ncbi:erg24, C-14 sterol reductase [Podochytrium sp. JEL0797]|nr:erg24, C-14 sterol reductase [Podochytrium sp. JEL0797]